MVAKKFVNAPEAIVAETLAGFTAAYPETVRLLPGTQTVVRSQRKASDKVAVVIGNGAGHEPACIGFVGENMLDANICGGLFAAPGPDPLRDAVEMMDSEAGVCVLISNHAGDVLNSKMALDMAEDDDLRCKGVILYDDIASAPKGEEHERRGTAGTLFNYKITGTYADQGHDLEAVCAMAERVRDNTRTLTVASIPGTSPVTGKPMFEIADDEVEIGIGVHGEAAAHNMKLKSAAEVAKVMTESLLEDGEYRAGDELAVIVNGCGQTTYMELLIFFNDVNQILKSRGIASVKPAIGNFITTQEMGGIALSFCRVDDTLKALWLAPSTAIGFGW
ncbi:dihydroxyacetone kinase subunit DhaK [Thaumasiovibrio subtropicus]|uniref:dihydroxyacetone kinase subunit DhaK n=1 Tax=Thaumasiovibrio subtropicus TaxID=1891207 RepID=UPI000B352636|nr:dihydroxyacetone kinase subunit DhaK [Thaumasiovibrio subtropicus]